MKLSKKDSQRELHITTECQSNARGFLICESNRYVPMGYTKGKWERTAIWVSLEELKKAMEFAESNGMTEG